MGEVSNKDGLFEVVEGEEPPVYWKRVRRIYKEKDWRIFREISKGFLVALGLILPPLGGN